VVSSTFTLTNPCGHIVIGAHRYWHPTATNPLPMNCCKNNLPELELSQYSVREALQMLLHTILFLRAPGPIAPATVATEHFSFSYSKIGKCVDVDKQIDEAINDFLLGLVPIGPELSKGGISLTFFERRVTKAFLGLVSTEERVGENGGGANGKESAVVKRVCFRPPLTPSSPSSLGSLEPPLPRKQHPSPSELRLGVHHRAPPYSAERGELHTGKGRGRRGNDATMSY